MFSPLREFPRAAARGHQWTSIDTHSFRRTHPPDSHEHRYIRSLRSLVLALIHLSTHVPTNATGCPTLPIGPHSHERTHACITVQFFMKSNLPHKTRVRFKKCTQSACSLVHTNPRPFLSFTVFSVLVPRNIPSLSLARAKLAPFCSSRLQGVREVSNFFLIFFSPKHFMMKLLKLFQPPFLY